MELSDRQHWQLGLRSWKPAGLVAGRSAWRRLPTLAQPLPFTEAASGKLDPELQRLLDLVPLPAQPPAPPLVQQPVAEMLPIGLFLRGIAFSGQTRVPAKEARQDGSCRHFFRYQVDWHGAGSDRSVDLVQLSAWATAEAIERSRKGLSQSPHSVRQFFRQIAWSGVPNS